MTKITCQYCQKEFSNIYTLKNHQKNAKYCLILQGKINKKELKCDFCDKILSSKQNLSNHQNLCLKNKYEEDGEIKMLKILNENFIKDSKKRKFL